MAAEQVTGDGEGLPRAIRGARNSLAVALDALADGDRARMAMRMRHACTVLTEALRDGALSGEDVGPEQARAVWVVIEKRDAEGGSIPHAVTVHATADQAYAAQAETLGRWLREEAMWPTPLMRRGGETLEEYSDRLAAVWAQHDDERTFVVVLEATVGGAR